MVLDPIGLHEVVLRAVLAVANLHCPWNGVCGVISWEHEWDTKVARGPCPLKTGEQRNKIP